MLHIIHSDNYVAKAISIKKDIHSCSYTISRIMQVKSKTIYGEDGTASVVL